MYHSFIKILKDSKFLQLPGRRDSSGDSRFSLTDGECTSDSFDITVIEFSGISIIIDRNVNLDG